MAIGVATVPLSLQLRRTCPNVLCSAGAQHSAHSSQSLFGDSLRRQLHCFSRRRPCTSLESHRECRNELRPLLRPCRRAILPSGKASKSASSGPVLDFQDAAADSILALPHSQTPIVHGIQKNGDIGMYGSALGGLGLLLACSLQFPDASVAATGSSFPTVVTFAGAEPSNALSWPTWVIHVASVVEWVTAMVLVWKYGETEGRSAWKGLTWGMVPLLGGAMCACTWHFFYNAESLEVLVVLQAFLTVVGNFTLWAAAYRIWKLSQEKVTVD